MTWAFRQANAQDRREASAAADRRRDAPAPGPGWLVIFLALAILAGEFVWARNLMDRLKQVGARLDPRKPKP